MDCIRHIKEDQKTAIIKQADLAHNYVTGARGRNEIFPVSALLKSHDVEGEKDP